MPDGGELDPQALGDHVDRLYRAAWGLCGSRRDAEALLRETFARARARRRIIRAADDPGQLLRVLRRVHRRARRTAARRPQEVAAADPAGPIPGPSPGWPRTGPSPGWPQTGPETVKLYAAVAELPDRFRDAVVAVDLMGLSPAEAARALRSTEATITARVNRGHQRLAHHLG